ncbi:erythromycin esterase family protein [Luteolibacter ambystomatis]|uniref:Erythromycin esterase family protein n=1 Tax=Luteolibacter ambystomatis TaxID=2824561 RepID=A0A975G5R5_9BACT|nr:erythromycin esterase family protein [Luteolibacter ambystomatis]QUE49256.1 erythromycin esterase family protein [Luteolibacter ambystomatis]
MAAATRSLENERDLLVQKAGLADFVLIGEASHGTREFYETRADLTRSLIERHGFRVIALEADWPDMLRVHRYASGSAEEHDANESLGDFRRFPRWMWRNETMPPFVDWLREWNRPLADGLVGIFGMDLYSLHSSIDAVLAYLEKVDKQAAARARERYACFDHFGTDPQLYGFATEKEGIESCEDEVIAQLLDIRKRKTLESPSDDPEKLFPTEQNAAVVANAERYYRAMFRGRNASWNLRDAHMDETIRTLARHYHLAGEDAKVIVWAHNSHLGDFRATEMSRRGEWNVGQLLKQRLGKRVFSIGFSSFAGTVTAADHWNEEPRRITMNPGLPGSYEEFFHRIGRESFWLDLTEEGDAVDSLREPMLQRAIGVIYRPLTERHSHYFYSCLPDQFDAIIHIDQTTAIHPLDHSAAPARDRPSADPAGRI